MRRAITGALAAIIVVSGFPVAFAPSASAKEWYTAEVVGGSVKRIKWTDEPDPSCVPTPTKPCTGGTPRQVNESYLPTYVTHNVSGNYQPLKYGQITTFSIGHPDSGIAPQTVGVPNTEWQIQDTVVGSKANLVGVKWSASQRCDFAGQVTGGGTLIYSACGAWIENYQWDRVDLRVQGANIGTQWMMGGVYGRGFCPLTVAGRSRGPLAPGSTVDSAARLPAVDADTGLPYTDQQYAYTSEDIPTQWGTSYTGGSRLPSTFLNDCYATPKDSFIGARLGKPGFSNGRYIVETEMYGSFQRVFEFRGDAGRLGRAYLPSPGKYVYGWSLSVPNSLTNASAGQLTDMSQASKGTLYSTTAGSISCHSRTWQENYSSTSATMENVWSGANWPDGGRTSYYYASDCATTPQGDPAPPGSNPSQPQGDPGIGITGICLFAREDPIVTNPNASLAAVAGPSGVVEVKADNDINAVDFTGDRVDIWVTDASGRGSNYTRDLSRDPVENDYKNVFGTLDREVPGTVSPSWIGTFDGNTSSNITEMNTPEGQPYATVPWADVEDQQTKRTAGTWEDLDRWIDVGSGAYPPGFGVGFDEASSPGNYWGMQTRWRSEGVYQMSVTTPGVPGNFVDWVNGAPVPSMGTTTPTTAQAWVSQTFQCDSKPLYLSARDIRVGPGF